MWWRASKVGRISNSSSCTRPTNLRLTRKLETQKFKHEVFFWQRVSLCKTSLHSCTLQQQPGCAQALALEVRIQKAPGKGGRKSLQIDICLVVAEAWKPMRYWVGSKTHFIWKATTKIMVSKFMIFMVSKFHVSGDTLLVSPVPSRVWLPREHCKWLSNVGLLENSLWFGTNHPYFSWSNDQSNLQWIQILYSLNSCHSNKCGMFWLWLQDTPVFHIIRFEWLKVEFWSLNHFWLLLTCTSRPSLLQVMRSFLS